jgi:hypothetical protein
MRYQLLGLASYEYSYNEDDIVGRIHREFEADGLEAAVEAATKMLDKDGYAIVEEGVLKLKDPWKKLSAQLRELKPVADLDFKPAEPERLSQPERVIPERTMPKCVIPAQPGVSALPARIEVRKL